MAALSKTNRTKVRVIVGVLGLWIAIAIGTALWPRFPSGNCPDTPPDTAYVCRVAFGQDFEKASRRRNVLVVLEIGVLLSVGSALWLLLDKPLRRRSIELGTEEHRRSPAGVSRHSSGVPVPQSSDDSRVPQSNPSSTPSPPPSPQLPAAPPASPMPVVPPAPPASADAGVDSGVAPAPVAQPGPRTARAEPVVEPPVAKLWRRRGEKRAPKEARKAEKLGRRAKKSPAESPKSGTESGEKGQTGRQQKS